MFILFAWQKWSFFMRCLKLCSKLWIFLQILTKWKVHYHSVVVPGVWFMSDGITVYTRVIYGKKLPMHDICHELCPFCSNLKSSLCMSWLDCVYMVSELYARSLFIGILSWHCNTFIHHPVPKVLISHKSSVQRDIIQWIY